MLEYSPDNNSFKKITALAFPSSSSFSTVPMSETKEGIWCMQENKGIIIYNPKNNICKVISDSATAFSKALITSPDILYKNLIAENNFFIFILTASNTILQINKQDHTFKNIKFRKGNILSLSCNADNLFIIGYKSLLSINIADNSRIKEILYKNFLKEKVISGAITTCNNNYVLVSINRHLYEFDSLLDNKKEFTTLSRNTIISTGDIQHIYADKFKRIWLLTNDDIKRIQNVDVPFEHFIYPGEKNNFVKSLYYDEQKHLLIAGCYNGAIQLYDTLANPLWQKPLVYPAAGYILSINKLSTDEYLLQGFGNGLFLLNLQAKKIQPYSLENFPELKSNIHSTGFDNNIQRINDSTIFICTTKNVFSCTVKKGKIISAEALLSNLNLGEEITCFIYSSKK
jgi:hypothetical protein